VYAFVEVIFMYDIELGMSFMDMLLFLVEAARFSFSFDIQYHMGGT
jgi:hypothetical protein